MRTTPFQFTEQTNIITPDSGIRILFESAFRYISIFVLVGIFVLGFGYEGLKTLGALPSLPRNIPMNSVTQNTSTQSQIEEERAPMPEPQIRKISAYNTAVAPSITITKAGQSLCNFVSLRDALRIAMKYKLVTYGEDSKVVVTSVAQGLALAKREKVVTIVTKGQEFLLE